MGQPLHFDPLRFCDLMNIRNILCFLALGLTLPLAACDDGDNGDTTSSDSNAESNDTNDDTNEETGDDSNDDANDDDEEDTSEPSPDVSCSTFCTNYVELCLQTGKSSEFELNDDCVDACDAWDQAGVNCRNEQILDDACDQAGNAGSAC